MFAWVVVRAEHAELLVKSLPRALTGGRLVLAAVAQPSPKARRIGVAWTEGARPRRAPQWPDVLADWHEINEDSLFPDDGLVVLAEEASGLGAPVLVAHGDHGLKQASIGWYAKGALESYDHVGGSSVSWTPDEGLSRPLTRAGAAAAGGKKIAALLGDDRSAHVLERIEKTNQAVGELLLERAFLTMLDADPPPIDELNGLVARAPRTRYPVP
jgi:hypothetical protein